MARVAWPGDWELQVYAPPGAEPLPGLPGRWLPLAGGRLRRARAAWLAQRRQRLSLWHAAWFAPPGPARRVVVIHDVLFATHPELFGRRQGAGLRTLVPLALRGATRVIATSATTRAALLQSYPWLDPARVALVPFGVDPEEWSARPDPADPQRLRAAGVPPGAPYLLAVGRPDRRKDLPRLLEAAAGLPARPLLVLAGPLRRAARALREAGQRVGLEPARLHLVESPDEATLGALYRGARLSCYPSRAEGVGLPVLEALGCGCPTVASRLPSLEEYAGQVPRWADAGDTASLAAALAGAWEDEAWLATARRSGPAQVARWPLAAMASGTLAVWRDALLPAS